MISSSGLGSDILPSPSCQNGGRIKVETMGWRKQEATCLLSANCPFLKANISSQFSLSKPSTASKKNKPPQWFSFHSLKLTSRTVEGRPYEYMYCFDRLGRGRLPLYSSSWDRQIHRSPLPSNQGKNKKLQSMSAFSRRLSEDFRQPTRVRSA